MVFGVTGAIFAESTLSYLGLLNIDMSWGMMIYLAQTDGYICCYCKHPWSFYTHYKTRGKGLKKRSKLTPETEHNFSIDRWDPMITYTYDNIRFCCLGCNNRKSSSTPLDWDNFKEAKDDIR